MKNKIEWYSRWAAYYTSIALMGAALGTQIPYAFFGESPEITFDFGGHTWNAISNTALFGGGPLAILLALYARRPMSS